MHLPQKNTKKKENMIKRPKIVISLIILVFILAEFLRHACYTQGNIFGGGSGILNIEYRVSS